MTLQNPSSSLRPHVEYSISAWSPHYIKDKNQIEKLQRRFMKMNPELHGLTYGNRLKALKLWTLEERRNRADLIEVFKLFRGISTLPFEKIFPAGHEQKNQRSLSKAEEKSLQHRTKKAFLLWKSG